MNTQNYSKEAIKTRMYRHAMNYWGIKKVENLDPLVKLLLEALSSELFGLSHEIEDSHNRMLDKIANMLTPDTLVHVHPAHGICHALPNDTAKAEITRDTGFFANLPFGKDRQKGKLSLYPVKNTVLYNGDVRKLICSGDIYKLDATMTKELVYRAPLNMAGLYNHTIWIGVKMDERIQKLENLPFYFEMPFRENRQSLYSLLAYSKWSFCGMPLSIQHGLPEEEESDNPETLFSMCNIEQEIEHDILTSYSNQFVRIASPLQMDVKLKSVLPEEIMEHYPASLFEDSEPLFWFRVKFPSNFTPDCLDELKVCMNAILVQNKRLKHFISKVNDLTAVIPLPTGEEEHFYSVASVSDIMDRKYTEIPYGGKGERSNTYVIRRGGCERMNSREVKEYLYRVLDLLQDRGAFIASLERDTFSSEIQEMDSLLNHMERMIKDIQSATGSLSYLLVDLSEKAEMLYVDYYTSNCEAANDLPVGTSLMQLEDSSLKRDSIFMLTTTRGGKSIPISANRFDMYKYALTTRDRIVTKTDILNFCRKELGKHLQNIRIEHGTMVSSRPHEGLVRSIDIYLTLKKDEERDLDFMVEDLENRLSSRSLDRFNYRIFIEKAG